MRLDKIRTRLAEVKRLWLERHKVAEKRLPTDLKSFLPPSLEVTEKPPHPAASSWPLSRASAWWA